jgi:hypothetical protein
MKRATHLLIPLLLLASLAGAQQTPQPQPAPSTTTPCNNPAPAPPHKQGWLEKKARDLACRQNKNLCDIPSSPDDITGTPSTPKPCTQTPTPKPPTPPAPPAPQAPTAPNAKPAYVCPPKTTLIPNYPYCIYPDHTVVDAIPLPASNAVPTAPQH